MKILKFTKERLGFGSKQLTTILTLCFIALPVSLLFLMMHQDSAFDLFRGFAKSKLSEGKDENATALDAGSKYNSSHPTGMSDGKHLTSLFGNGTSSKNGSSQATGTVDDRLLNQTFVPVFREGSGDLRLRNDSSQPNDRLLNQPVAPRFGEGLGSSNESFQPTKMPDDKLLNPSSVTGYGEGSDQVNNSSQATGRTDDRLLLGLLAPGFDERSCLSRYQSFHYRRTSPHEPPSYLLSKLRKYEDLHKRCGPSSTSYRRAVKSLTSKHRITKSCKYVVWIPANGLGNRMISMTSTFLYALLTNRVLLVDQKPEMADLFCEPFPNSSWLLPKQFPLRGQFYNDKVRHSHSYGSILKKSSINISMESPPSYLFLHLNHGNYHLDEHCFYCDQGQDLLPKVPWLMLLSDQYFVPSFFLMPLFKKEVSKLFPEKESVFHHLGRYLFHPSNQVWGLITRFYEAYLAKADQRIGLQIRVFYPKIPHQIIIEQILACTLQEKMLPQVVTQNSVTSWSENRTSKAILVTSLYPDFYEKISNLYWANPTVTGEVIGVYQPSHEECQLTGNNTHNMKAWADMYLLSLSDVLVTSAWSTFGYVAQGLAGLKPWILPITDGNHVPDPPCKQDISIEPCFHFPVTYDCNAKKEADPGVLVPYLRHCLDLTNGVKLVSDDHDQV